MTGLSTCGAGTCHANPSHMHPQYDKQISVKIWYVHGKLHKLFTVHWEYITQFTQPLLGSASFHTVGGATPGMCIRHVHVTTVMISNILKSFSPFSQVNGYFWNTSCLTRWWHYFRHIYWVFEHTPTMFRKFSWKCMPTMTINNSFYYHMVAL